MNKVVIITGTRKGIGQYLATYFLNQGYIVIGCSRKSSDIDNPNYRHYVLDVSSEADVIKMIKEVSRDFKRIDVLINNAGAASMNHCLITPYQTAKRLIETNYLGTFNLSREVAKVMLKHSFGRIINFTTVAVPLNLEGELVYSSSKAAVEQLTKVMANELGNTGITVNAIGPTPIETDLIKNVPQNKIDELLARQAIKKLGTFQDVLNVIKFFIMDESSFVTGQILYLGGVN